MKTDAYPSPLKCYWCSEPFLYDGSQLHSLFAYTRFGVLGDSVVAWVGPCEVPQSRILDVEDRRNHQSIGGKEMLHFVIELFDTPLSFGVLLQRIIADLARELLYDMSPLNLRTSSGLLREGDDLYEVKGGEKRGKLSISVATKSPLSTLIHFALNIVPEKVPVKAAHLKAFHIEPKAFAEKLMASLRDEIKSVVQATQKVRPVL